MGWKERLRELAVAGGLVAAGASCGGSAIPACNANPDPCCSAPQSSACATYTSCLNEGGWGVSYTNVPDGGQEPVCSLYDGGTAPIDAGH
ncbi:MAG: hypothetical protein JST92_08455 [Deltaproteobacteria bacterium]|nr:hypothetical protein [Deltaproteobacteria bacterium]